MPNELIGHLRGLPSTVRARLHKGGQTFNVSTGAWVNFSAGSWAQYLVTMAPDTGTGIYFGDLPAAAADAEYATFYEGTSLGVVRAWQILRLGGPFAATGITGQTMRAIIKNGLLTWRRTTSAWVTHNDADWADYLITVTEDTGTGVYSAALPVGAESWTHIRHHNGLSVGEADLVQFRNTAVPVPASYTVTSPTITFTPRAVATSSQRVTIYRGSGVPVKFTQTGSPVSIDPTAFEARLGVQYKPAAAIRFTTANGKLIDNGDNTLTANVTEADTASLSLSEQVVFEMWRIDTDDTKTVVGKANVTVLNAIRP